MSKNTNMELWGRAFVTDPAAVKPITGKPYKGNSPRPYWIVQRLTEEFGPCGIGWGFTIIQERFERFSDTDTLHVASIRFWYMLGEKRGEVEQVGQTVSSYVTSKNDFKVDEDAPKKSVTDALVKCASYLGFAGDIFSGRWDDSGYIAEAREHYRGNDGPSKPRGKFDAVQEIRDGVDRGDVVAAAEYLATLPQKALDGIWSHLEVTYQDKLTEAWPKE